MDGAVRALRAALVRSAAFGYLLSAMFGTGLVVLASLGVAPAGAGKRQRMRAGFIEHTTEGLYSAMERALYAEGLAARRWLAAAAWTLA